MLEQHLLDLARVDVAATADHDVLGAVAQGQEAALVERAHVAGVQPAVLQRRRGGLGVLPVAGHHDVTAADDLADLADGGRRAVRRAAPRRRPRSGRSRPTRGSRRRRRGGRRGAGR